MRCGDDEGGPHCIFLLGFKRQPITKLNLKRDFHWLAFDGTLEGAANQEHLTFEREAMRVPTKAAMRLDSCLAR